MPHFYPSLDPVTVRNMSVVKRLYLENPNYFDESPYPIEVENFFKENIKSPEIINSEATIDVVAELENTYRGLKNHKPDSTDTSATMGYYRTATSLLEKLLEQIERGKNIKQISDFYRAVLQILDDICTPAQRTTIQQQLSEWAEHE